MIVRESLAWSLTAVGMAIHHGGPFDAANMSMGISKDKSKSRSKKYLPPIGAFPDGSKNMSMAGAGPTGKSAKDQQYDTLHMVNDEAHGDFNSVGTVKRTEIMPMDATARGEQIHSSETAGLGTSTFLDGAPAPRNAMLRRESETAAAQQEMPSGGLGRKASILRPFQRARGMSFGANVQSRPFTSGDDSRRYPPVSLMPQSAGGMPRTLPGQEQQNPFEIQMDEKRNVSAPIGEPLVRRVTEGGPRPPPKDYVPPPSQTSSGPGFLRRLKSVRGNVRAAPAA